MRPSPVALNPTPSNTLKPQSPETPKPRNPKAPRPCRPRPRACFGPAANFSARARYRNPSKGLRRETKAQKPLSLQTVLFSIEAALRVASASLVPRVKHPSAESKVRGNDSTPNPYYHYCCYYYCYYYYYYCYYYYYDYCYYNYYYYYYYY